MTGRALCTILDVVSQLVAAIERQSEMSDSITGQVELESGPKQEIAVRMPAPQTYPQFTAVMRAVAEIAAEMDDTVALKAGPKILTCHDLDYQANRVAHYLRSIDVGAGVLAGLCLPRSLDMAVGALGISVGARRSETGGKMIGRRATVVAAIGAANREAERFPDPGGVNTGSPDNSLALGRAAFRSPEALPVAFKPVV